MKVSHKCQAQPVEWTKSYPALNLVFAHFADMDVQFVLYIEGRAVEEEKEEIFIDCRTEDAIFGWVDW